MNKRLKQFYNRNIKKSKFELACILIQDWYRLVPLAKSWVGNRK